MKEHNSHLLLPAALSAGSFLSLLAVVLLSDPVKNISYAVVFFGALLTFLISVSYLMLLMHAGRVSPAARSRVIITSVILVIFVMFRSAGSLSWVDLLVLLLLGGGLLFYSGRRSF